MKATTGRSSRASTVGRSVLRNRESISSWGLKNMTPSVGVKMRASYHSPPLGRSPALRCSVGIGSFSTGTSAGFVIDGSLGTGELSADLGRAGGTLGLFGLKKSKKSSSGWSATLGTIASTGGGGAWEDCGCGKAPPKGSSITPHWFPTWPVETMALLYGSFAGGAGATGAAAGGAGLKPHGSSPKGGFGVCPAGGMGGVTPGGAGAAGPGEEGPKEAS
mmetsp:Transcript_4543/g.9542  ORF Transcript_4543/g.9542 Transcript_4543/m.9542 type:complete len:219 (+) Transcript_4543:1018-1674(+)